MKSVSVKDMFEYMSTPEFQEVFLHIVKEDRQKEIAFRRKLVNDFNSQLETAGLKLTPSMMEEQERFVSLTMSIEEVHAMAAQYAGWLGQHLPSPPPSVTLEDI